MNELSRRGQSIDMERFSRWKPWAGARAGFCNWTGTSPLSIPLRISRLAVIRDSPETELKRALPLLR